MLYDSTGEPINFGGRLSGFRFFHYVGLFLTSHQMEIQMFLCSFLRVFGAIKATAQENLRSF